MCNSALDLTLCIQGLSWEFEQRLPITSKSSKFKGTSQHYLVKLPKSTGARHYCLKIARVPGTLGTHANSSPDRSYILLGLLRVVCGIFYYLADSAFDFALNLGSNYGHTCLV